MPIAADLRHIDGKKKTLSEAEMTPLHRDKSGDDNEYLDLFKNHMYGDNANKASSSSRPPAEWGLLAPTIQDAAAVMAHGETLITLNGNKINRNLLAGALETTSSDGKKASHRCPNFWDYQ